MNKSHRFKASVLKAIAHPVRYCIVEGLIAGEQCVAKMVACTGVSQPTVSQHLTILKAAGIISAKRVGNQMFYTVVSAEAQKIVHCLV